MKVVAFALSALLLSLSAYAQVCEPTSEKHAVKIGGASNAPIEIYGDKEYFQNLENGWVFALLRTELGWSARLFDKEPIGDAVDLTALSPPLRGAPNPRDIEGWHFRNTNNTGPNLGDVNAPQSLRGFVISPTLVGTGGLRPPKNAVEPNPTDGMGWIKVLDLGLDNSGDDERARLTYLKFEGCLSWPRTPAETDAYNDLASMAFEPEDLETYGACGLPLRSHALSASILPRQLGGDLDGDGALDQVVQIVRIRDDRRGLALCRAGTWLSLIDLGDGSVPGLRPGYVAQVEAWQWVSQNEDLPRHLIGYEMPEAEGDYLVLERFEKEAFVVFWKGGELRAQRIYGHVEP